MSKIKIGVIGVGALGRHHARLYKGIENAEVIGIFDLDEKGLNAVAAEFDLTPYTDMNELADKCDALSIAVPATKHYEVAVDLLKKGKHLLIEKPLATDINHAREIVQVAQEKNLVLGVGHVERFNPAMTYLEEHVSETRFIEVHRLAMYPPPRPGQHRRGVEVGVVLDLMIHDIDLVLTMVKSELAQIDAVGIPVMSETEDIANVRLKFKNGAVANITSSRVSQEPTRRFRVFQSDAYISMDYGKHVGVIAKKGAEGVEQEIVQLDDLNALELELQDFVNCVEKTINTGAVVPAKVSGEQGLKALEVAVKVSEEIVKYNKQHNW